MPTRTSARVGIIPIIAVVESTPAKDGGDQFTPPMVAIGARCVSGFDRGAALLPR